MRTKRLTSVFIAALMMLTIVGCDFANDIIDSTEELIYGKQDDDNDDGPPRGYDYIPAFSLGAEAAVVDPYDGSIELIDPITKGRRSIKVTWDSRIVMPVEDGAKILALDPKRNQLRVIDTDSEKILHIIDVGETVNTLVASPFGDYALAYYDPEKGSAEFGQSGTVNYFELDIIDYAQGTFKSMSIDFSPDKIVFAPDGDNLILGKDVRLVSLSLSSADAVVYPLTLKPDDPLTPAAISVSPDSAFVLVTVKNSKDVYIIDLLTRYTNIIDLEGNPEDVTFVPDVAQPDKRIALIPMRNMNQIVKVDLDDPMPETIELDYSVETGIISPDGLTAVFYGSHERVLLVMDLQDFDTEVLPLSVAIQSKPVFSPDSTRVLIVGKPGSNTYGTNDVDIVDLVTMHVAPIGFEGEIRDVVFSENQPTLGVLLGDVHKFVLFDLETLTAESWPTKRKAKSLFYLPDSNAFAIDYKNLKRGKVLFIGDQGTDLFWIAARFFSWD